MTRDLRDGTIAGQVHRATGLHSGSQVLDSLLSKVTASSLRFSYYGLIIRSCLLPSLASDIAVKKLLSKRDEDRFAPSKTKVNEIYGHHCMSGLLLSRLGRFTQSCRRRSVRKLTITLERVQTSRGDSTGRRQDTDDPNEALLL